MTTPAPAIAPYVPTYASRQPYITSDEYTAAPTAVNSGNLVAGGTAAQNMSELGNVIARASSMADVYCRQVLAATLDLQAGEYRVRNGMIKVPLDNTPVISVTAVLVGYQVGQLQALTDLSGVWFQRKVVTIPLLQMNAISPVYLTAAYAPSGLVFAQVSYINGYPNTMLMSIVDAGATSIVVDSGLGIYPGSVLTVYDDQPGVEQVTVAPSYVVGSTTVPLVDPLLQQHQAGVSVSALPPAIKQAVIHLTSALIKTRGNLAIVAGKLQAAPTKTQAQSDDASDDIGAAEMLLTPFRRVA